jgi:hypothetical protein
MTIDREGADAALPSPGRLWTVDEANAHLDTLRELLPRLRAWAARLEKIYEDLHRLTEFWGKEVDASDHPDRELKVRLDGEWRDLKKRCSDELLALHEEGIEVKDLASGLVDFYGLQQGEVVFLCWQHGEESVGFFHPLQGSYRDRRPVVPGSTRLPARRASRPH